MALTVKTLRNLLSQHYHAQLLMVLMLLSACETYGSASSVPASLVGVQHMGKNFSVAEFYVNGYEGGTAGRLGGGGAYVCCVSLPGKWRSGLKVEVRWKVTNWTNEIRSEIANQNYRSLSFDGPYIARVPVEKYDAVGDLYVHFFANGRVRVVSSSYSPLHASHPVRFNDELGGGLATAGVHIKKITEEVKGLFD